jgi:hypothetical protein
MNLSVSSVLLLTVMAIVPVLPIEVSPTIDHNRGIDNISEVGKECMHRVCSRLGAVPPTKYRVLSQALRSCQ